MVNAASTDRNSHILSSVTSLQTATVNPTASFGKAVDVFKEASEVVLGVAFNRVKPSMAVVATAKGLREFNLESSLRFRPRSHFNGTLVVRPDQLH